MIFFAALNFGSVANMTEILRLHVVPLNFQPKVKIKTSISVTKCKN